MKIRWAGRNGTKRNSRSGCRCIEEYVENPPPPFLGNGGYFINTYVYGHN